MTETATSRKFNLSTGKIVLIIGAAVAVVLISIPFLKGQFFMMDLRTSIENEVLPLSKYIADYSLSGYYGNKLKLTLSDDFDNLPLEERYTELGKVLKKHEEVVDILTFKYILEHNMDFGEITDYDQLPVVIAHTTSNSYEYNSIQSLTVNTEEFYPEDFGFTDPADQKIVFEPPIEVELILTDNHPFVLAADSIINLIDYGMYNVRDNNDPELRKIYDQGYAYYLTEDTKVLLLEIDRSFARIQLIEPHHDKKIGDIGWIREENIRSYPKQ